jgi:hypothetical protein
MATWHNSRGEIGDGGAELRMIGFVLSVPLIVLAPYWYTALWFWFTW